MNKTLYLKLNQISEIHEKRVYLKDIAEIYSDDPALMAKCLALKIRTVPDDHNGRYVDSVITVLEKSMNWTHRSRSITWGRLILSSISRSPDRPAI